MSIRLLQEDIEKLLNEMANEILELCKTTSLAGAVQEAKNNAEEKLLEILQQYSYDPYQ